MNLGREKCRLHEKQKLRKWNCFLIYNCQRRNETYTLWILHFDFTSRCSSYYRRTSFWLAIFRTFHTWKKIDTQHLHESRLVVRNGTRLCYSYRHYIAECNMYKSHIAYVREKNLRSLLRHLLDSRNILCTCIYPLLRYQLPPPVWDTPWILLSLHY